MTVGSSRRSSASRCPVGVEPDQRHAPFRPRRARGAASRGGRRGGRVQPGLHACGSTDTWPRTWTLDEAAAAGRVGPAGMSMAAAPAGSQRSTGEIRAWAGEAGPRRTRPRPAPALDPGCLAGRSRGVAGAVSQKHPRGGVGCTSVSAGGGMSCRLRPIEPQDGERPRGPASIVRRPHRCDGCPDEARLRELVTMAGLRPPPYPHRHVRTTSPDPPAATMSVSAESRARRRVTFASSVPPGTS